MSDSYSDPEVSKLFRVDLSLEPGEFEQLAMSLKGYNVDVNYFSMLPCRPPGEQPRRRVITFTTPNFDASEQLQIPSVALYRSSGTLYDVETIYDFFDRNETDKKLITSLLPQPKNYNQMCIAISPYVDRYSDPNHTQLYIEACDKMRQNLSRWAWCEEVIADVQVISFSCKPEPGQTLNVLRPFAHEPQLEPAAVPLTWCSELDRAFRIVFRGDDDIRKAQEAYAAVGWTANGYRGYLRPYVTAIFRRRPGETLLSSLIDVLEPHGAPLMVGRVFTFPLDPFEADTVYAIEPFW